jgi:hypothetical protein
VESPFLSEFSSCFFVIAELGSDGTIKKWGYCLDDCPAEEPVVACLTEPIFPVSTDDDGYHQNYTTEYLQGSGQILLDMDYVVFECPPGYVFEGSTNITHYAFCHNWNYSYPFDLQQSCIRMHQFKISFLQIKTSVLT